MLPAATPPAASAAPPCFGLLVGDRPCSTDCWVASGEGRLYADVPAPASVTELAIFLLPGVALPPDRGVVVYASVPPYSAWTVLSALGPGRPTVFIRPEWASQPEFASAATVRLGLSLEPPDAVAAAASAVRGAEDSRGGLAELIARDLAAFLGSFSASTTAGERRTASSVSPA